MSDRVLISVPGLGVLALDPDVYRKALAEGALLHRPAPTVTDEPLQDAEELAQQFGIPPSWLEQKGREGVIPSIEFGRWRRFKRSAVEAALAANAAKN